MAIKKAFIPLLDLLTENANKKVSSIMDEVTALAETKGGGGGGTPSFHRDESSGYVTFVKDFYFKVWLPVCVGFGVKTSSASGLNSTCKYGSSKYAKQNRDYNTTKQEVLKKLLSGDLNADEANALIAEAEEAKQAREAFPVPSVAFDTLEDALKANYEDLCAEWERYENEVAQTEEI